MLFRNPATGCLINRAAALDKTVILSKDQWPMNARWQQRAQAKRIHPVAYSASILPSYEENAPSVLPRWAPTGSLPGCSHAKWLQMRGMIWCWLRAKQNLPGNLATCSSKSQYLSTETDHSHFAHICVGFWTPFFFHIHILWQSENIFWI